MTIKNRVNTCDVCGTVAEEVRFGDGWPGWCHIQGIGAKAPEEGASIAVENMELYLCPECKERVAQFITDLQSPIVRVI